MGKIEKLPVEVSGDLLESARSAVACGEFVSIEHVVAAALRDWQTRRRADIGRIAAMIDEGIESGFEPWDGVDAIIADGRRSLADGRG